MTPALSINRLRVYLLVTEIAVLCTKTVEMLLETYSTKRAKLPNYCGLRCTGAVEV